MRLILRLTLGIKLARYCPITNLLNRLIVWDQKLVEIGLCLKCWLHNFLTAQFHLELWWLVSKSTLRWSVAAALAAWSWSHALEQIAHSVIMLIILMHVIHKVLGIRRSIQFFINSSHCLEGSQTGNLWTTLCHFHVALWCSILWAGRIVVFFVRWPPYKESTDGDFVVVILLFRGCSSILLLLKHLRRRCRQLLSVFHSELICQFSEPVRALESRPLLLKRS